MKRLLVYLSFLLVSGCLFDPDLNVDNCEVRCVAECPGDMRCVSGFCVHPGFDLGVPRGCPAGITIAVDSDQEVLSCQPFDLSLRAVRGGEELMAVTWTATELTADGTTRPLPPELELDGERATLSAPAGFLSDGNAVVIQLRVEDDSGRSETQTLKLEGVACTRIEPTFDDEETVCIGEQVEVPLQAAGGSGKYEWTLEGEPSFVSLDVENQVLRIDATGPEQDYDLELVVRNATNDDDVASHGFALAVRDCPRLQVDGIHRLCLDSRIEEPVELNTTGGTPPYEWSTSGLPEGLELDEESGTITGTPTRGRAVDVELVVVDNEGLEGSATVRFEVQHCPTMTPRRVNACVNVEFQQTLEADVPSTWQEREEDEPRRPDWIVFDGGSGTVSGTPQDEGEFVLPLSVSSVETGMTRSEDLQIIVGPSDGCTSPALVEDSALELCAGHRFVHQLTTQRGAVSEWYLQGTSLSWLQLDPDTGIMRGTPPPGTSGTYEILVALWPEVGTSPSYETYELRVRSNCKFGFLALDGGRTRLFLADTRYNGPGVRDLSVDLPDAVDVGVFAFSTDGLNVAFGGRATLAGAPDRLWSAPVTDWTDGSLDATEEMSLPDGVDAIIDLAWSRDSQRLAVLYQDSSGVARLLAFSLRDGRFLAGSPETVPLSAEKRVFWLGPGVCYLAATEIDATYVSVYCHELLEDGRLGSPMTYVPTPMTAERFATAQMLLGDHEVLFFSSAVEDSDYDLTYTFHDGTVMVTLEHEWAIPDPSFTWLAQPGNKQQKERGEVGIWPLLPSVETYGESRQPPATVFDCRTIAAWEPLGRGLACETSDALRIALIDEGETLTLDQRDVANSEGFPLDTLPRSFDHGGNWFLYFTSAGQLMAVDVSSDSWTAEVLDDYPATDHLALKGTGEPHQFLLQVDSQLHWLDLAKSETVRIDGGQVLELPRPCQSRFDVVGPRGWCGGYAGVPFRHFDDGSAVVFRNEVGQPYVVDLASADRAAASATLVHDATITCADFDCVREIKLVQ